MNIRRALKTVGAVIYKNRAKIETIAGMSLVVIGTGHVISKAREAAQVSDTIEKEFDAIHETDRADGWTDKKERSRAVRTTLKTAAKGYTKAYWFGLTCELVGLVLIEVSDITQAKELQVTSTLLATTSEIGRAHV